MSHWIKSSRDGRIEKTVEDSFSKDTYLHWNTSSEYIAGEDLHALKILHYTRQICKTILGLRKKKKTITLHHQAQCCHIRWDHIDLWINPTPQD
jgi:hypothetical protein